MFTDAIIAQYILISFSSRFSLGRSNPGKGENRTVGNDYILGVRSVYPHIPSTARPHHRSGLIEFIHRILALVSLSLPTHIYLYRYIYTHISIAVVSRTLWPPAFLRLPPTLADRICIHEQTTGETLKTFLPSKDKGTRRLRSLL